MFQPRQDTRTDTR